MWRKEQHFVTTNSGDSTDATMLFETNICYTDSRRRKGTLPGRYMNCNERGLDIYKGREFDIFGCDIVVQTTDDHDQSQCYFGKTIANNAASDNSKVPTLEFTAGIPIVNNNKRKAQGTFGMENGSKHNRLIDTTFTTLNNGRFGPAGFQTARLGTNFFRRTTPTGSPMDLFKAAVGDGDCFCTQNYIYS